MEPLAMKTWLTSNFEYIQKVSHENMAKFECNQKVSPENMANFECNQKVSHENMAISHEN